MANAGQPADGTARKVGDGYVLRFERFLPHPVAKVWATLTDPARRAEWLAAGPIELTPGGRVRLEFSNTGDVVEGMVRAVEPPVLLEFTWGDGGGFVRWELTEVAGGTSLEITHTVPSRDEGIGVLAGWHSHLELLALVLAEQPAPWSQERWQELRGRYARSLTD
jgi:uncharacterized protein YndB with AHSA1/START domain